MELVDGVRIGSGVQTVRFLRERIGRPFRPGAFSVALLSSLTLVVLLAGGCGGSSSPGSGSGSSSLDGTSDRRASSGGELAFEEVTESAGLGSFRHHTGARGDKWMPETMGSGAAFLDYDGDGWLDVLLVGGGHWQDERPEDYRALWLYRNQGDGSFALRTEEAGLAGLDVYGFGIAAADVDDDGDPDLFLTTLGRNRLLENRNGRFVDVTDESGLGRSDRWSTSAVFFDPDRDGSLDLYVGNYVEWSPETNIECMNDAGDLAYCTPILYEGVAGRYYRNDGSGRFVDRSAEAGFLPSPGKTLGVVELDVDRNGWPDLAVANDIARNLLFVNDGSGRFEERGMASGIALDRDGLSRSGMGIDAGVVDSTGEISLFVGNFSRETIGVFRHRESGLFEDRASATGIARASRLTLTFGLFLFDPDLDGDLDLFAANGHIRPSVDEVSDAVSYRQAPHLFVNRGDGTFEDRAGEKGTLFRDRLVARGAAYGDYDRDGDQDVLVSESGAGARLYRNESEGGRVLRVRLEGTESNREGLGSVVEAYLGGDRLERRVATGASYMSQSETATTLGLDSRRAVDSLVVHWPSGRSDRMTAVEADQSVLVGEGRGILERRALEAR